MNTINIEAHVQNNKFSRPIAMLLTTILATPLFVGCGSPNSNASLSPIDDSRSNTYNPPKQQQTRPGLSGGQKIGITLVGAAALYYLYNQHKNSQAQGAEGQYYLSKNGRVYYRDSEHRAHWVTPPTEGIQVSEEQGRQYQDYQGYNNRSTGRDLTGLASQDPEPQFR
jgi:hypothetical protein